MEIVDLKSEIEARYSEVAEGTGTCGSLCGCTENAEGLALAFGYSIEDLAGLPEGANLGLSCGNPQALAVARAGPGGARPRQRRGVRCLAGGAHGSGRGARSSAWT